LLFFLKSFFKALIAKARAAHFHCEAWDATAGKSRGRGAVAVARV
jgi:hypothetical protein